VRERERERERERDRERWEAAVDEFASTAEVEID
jgi:hypothetical protein